MSVVQIRSITNVVSTSHITTRKATDETFRKYRSSCRRTGKGAAATSAVQAIVEFYKVDQGTGKNGRAYTKHRIGWTGIDGKLIYGTTFSASDGEVACESMNLNCPCEITFVTGQYGLDIKSVKMSTLPMSATDFAGGDDEIPF